MKNLSREGLCPWYLFTPKTIHASLRLENLRFQDLEFFGAIKLSSVKLTSLVVVRDVDCRLRTWKNKTSRKLEKNIYIPTAETETRFNKFSGKQEERRYERAT